MGQGQAEEKKSKKDDDKVVLRVDMDCEACKQKVRKVLKNFPGVENIDLDVNEQKVTVKGKVDARNVYEAVKKKCGKRTMLLYPELSKEDEDRKKEDLIIDSISKIVGSITDLLNPKPPDTIVELKVRMHCRGCAKQIKKSLLRMDGVVEVNEDLASDKVVVKGRGLDADAVCERIRRSGKHCEVVPPPAPPKKEEKREEKREENKKKEEKKKEEKKKEEDKKKEDKKEEKQPVEDGGGDGKVEVKKFVYPPYHSIPEYVYPPQLFSDENPNACAVM